MRTKAKDLRASVNPISNVEGDPAVRGAITDVAKALQDLLGQKLTAVIAGVVDAGAVGDWSRGDRKPHPKAETRLRAAYHVVTVLAANESSDTIRAWFIGMNPELDDRPPALVIAEDPIQVMRAARVFVAHN